MKQAVTTGPGRIEIRDVEPPAAGEGQVLVRIRRIGICGSDVHVWHGTHPYTSYPVVQGHEYAGQVEAVGAGVADIRCGMKVTGTPQRTCGRCRPCLRGDYHICDSLAVEGFQAPGCAQELFVIDAARVVPLPEEFTFEQGALVEPAAVAVHAVARAGETAGPDLPRRGPPAGEAGSIGIAVLGAGPIGNLVAQVARASGANVLITDLSDHRLRIAGDCGLEATSNARRETLADAATRVFGDAGLQVALECAGAEAAIASAVEAIEKGGTIVVVGVFGDRPPVDLGLVQDRELNIRGTLMYQRRDYERAVELIASGAIVTDPLICEHYPLEDCVLAYEQIDRAGDRVMKVFIDV